MLIEAKMMRMKGHAIHDAAQYVPARRFEYWRARDPIAQLSGQLVRRGIVTEPAVASARQQAADLMAEIGSVLLEPVPGGTQGSSQPSKKLPRPSGV